ncbi:M16 family metallopeptidase [Xanthovirga aplysinae]|uniref:M16 family metallopeptidase n=1 Tax=Xanthovirga aplysinae TaxID=2529853 RepID=UPI0012BBA155|nr:pitrilysin family protein [Xanthovirga aplysinae]MTI33459.1 insulinase family protein [Xanthovirga aplysinae]
MKPKYKFPWAVLIAILVMATTACDKLMDPADTSHKEEFSIDYEKYILDNGLEVVLHQDKSDPIVAAAILVHAGSNREKPGKTGFAHFFEHMLFQDSENVGKGQFFTKINELGGTFNGGTWQDGTVYYEVVPKDALEKILWMESDRMGFFINTVTRAGLENEKQVVKNEKRQRVDNQPYGHTNEVILSNLYPKGHPYSWTVIGSLEDLQNAKLEDVTEFYNKYYGPNNCTLVLAGDFEAENVKPLIEKYFAEIPAKQKVEPLPPMPVELAETKVLYHEDNFASLPEIRLTFPTVEQFHEDSYALNALGEILADGKRAQLYKTIVEDKKLAPEVSAYNSSEEIAGTFSIRIRANNGVNMDTLYSAVKEALVKFDEKGFEDKDLERIKAVQETAFYNGISSILNKAFQLVVYNEFAGDPGFISEDIARVKAVSKEDVMRVFRKYIKGKNHIVTNFVPKGETHLVAKSAISANIVEEEIIQGVEETFIEEEGGQLAYAKTPSSFDRSIEPDLSEPPLITLPEVWTSSLSNGMKVYGIEANELPLIQFSVRLMGGLILDDPDNVGAANMITDLMMEGTANKTPEELEDAIGQLGANISMSTSEEFITLTANCLASKYEETLELVEEILLQPRWDIEEFERIKKLTINRIQQRNANPNAVANSVFNKLMFGDDHILSKSIYGKIENVEKMTLEDIKTYYSKAFSPYVANFHVAGDIPQTKIMESLKSLEKAWKSAKVSFPMYDLPDRKEEPTYYFVDIPDAKQSVIQIGQLAPAGKSREFFEIHLANYRLGAGSAGRLFQTLREEKGYTYGAYSFIQRRKDRSLYKAVSSVRSNVTYESVEIFNDLIGQYQRTYTQDDLDKTSNTLVKENTRRFETLFSLLGMLQNISTYELPVNYIEENQKVLAQTTIEDVKTTIERHMNPMHMTYLIVGDKKSQLERLVDAGIKPILLDREGNPITEETVM